MSPKTVIRKAPLPDFAVFNSGEQRIFGLMEVLALLRVVTILKRYVSHSDSQCLCICEIILVSSTYLIDLEQPL